MIRNFAKLRISAVAAILATGFGMPTAHGQAAADTPTAAPKTEAAEGNRGDMPRLSILGIFAHPADMATESGGTLALHAERGDRVEVAVLTHGGRIHPNIYVEEARKKGAARDEDIAAAEREAVLAVKHAEMESAARILGIGKVHALDFEDNQFTLNEAMVRRVADVILETRPDIIVTHHPGFNSGIGDSHCLAGQVAVAAQTLAAQQLANLDARAAHHVRQMFFISVGVSSRDMLTPGGGPSPDTYIDITSVVKKKVQAMDQFVSQGYEGDFARKCVTGHNGHWGSLARVAFAEPYMRGNPETHSLLPLTRAALGLDVLTSHRAYSKGADIWKIPVAPSPTKKRTEE